MLNLFKENFNLILPLLVFLTGWALPVPRFKTLGKQLGVQLPSEVAKLISERLRAFEHGLLQAAVKGDANLVDNDIIKNEMKKVRLDMGLEN